MVQVVFTEPDGNQEEVDVPEGWSLMQAAINHGVEGIEGECGGSCCCATCHVYVDEAYLDKLETMADNENEMLDNTASERKATSRLACQVKASADLDGLVVQIPEEQ
jgi:2Fe-2S ferredoxin